MFYRKFGTCWLPVGGYVLSFPAWCRRTPSVAWPCATAQQADKKSYQDGYGEQKCMKTCRGIKNHEIKIISYPFICWIWTCFSNVMTGLPRILKTLVSLSSNMWQKIWIRCIRCYLAALWIGGLRGSLTPHLLSEKIRSIPWSSWWFQPIWKISVQIGWFPQIGMKIKMLGHLTIRSAFSCAYFLQSFWSSQFAYNHPGVDTYK